MTLGQKITDDNLDYGEDDDDAANDADNEENSVNCQ